MPWHCHGTAHGIPWHPHGISWRGVGCHRTPWHTTGGSSTWQPPRQPPQHPSRHSMATPRLVMPTPTVPQCLRHLPRYCRVMVRTRVRVPWYAVEVCGRFRGMQWKVLPQVVARQCHGMSRKRAIMYPLKHLVGSRETAPKPKMQAQHNIVAKKPEDVGADPRDSFLLNSGLKTSLPLVMTQSRHTQTDTHRTNARSTDPS